MNLSEHMRAAAYAALTLMALALGWTSVMVGHHIAFTLGRFDGVLDTVNRPCGRNASCGTLADVAKTLNTIRGAAGQIEIAAKHENAQLATLDKQEDQLVADLHGNMGALHTVLNDAHDEMLEAHSLTLALTETSRQATTDLATANITIASADPLLRDADRAAADLSSILARPDIPEAITHADSMTASGDRILRDAADEADKFVHPPKRKLTFWVALETGLDYARKFIPPLF